MFEQLDFVYMPSRDVAADIEHYTRTLGGELVFAIEAFGTRVAMVRLARDQPGRGAELVAPGPQRLAIYERAWPEKGESLAGRRDF